MFLYCFANGLQVRQDPGLRDIREPQGQQLGVRGSDVVGFPLGNCTSPPQRSDKFGRASTPDSVQVGESNQPLG